MNILWISNYALPVISAKLGMPPTQNEGWKITMSNQLVEAGNELTVAFPIANIDSFQYGDADNIKFIAFPVDGNLNSRTKNIQKEKEAIKEVVRHEDYDVIHIWGTEFPHSLATVQASIELNNINKVAISVQGIAMECAIHYFSGVEYKYIKKQCLIDKVRNKSIYKDSLLMKKRGEIENQVFSMAKNVIGRTDFDKRYIKLLNPQCRYFHCNETLRNIFYNNVWNYDECEKYSIFMSQATYSLKGLHIVLQALGLVKKKYPNVRLYIAGGDMLLRSQKRSIIRRLVANHAYSEYLNHIVDEFDLEDNIVSLGTLDAEEMKNNYLRANAYLLASSIENSPNSLGEAMLLGVPCIASNVGGVASMCTDDQEAFLYQHDDYYMLAARIIELFESKDLQLKLSILSRKKAMDTHNPIKNFEDLMSIYEQISGQ